MPEILVGEDAGGEEDEYLVVQDCIGQGVDVRLYCERGILSIVLVIDNGETGGGLVAGPSAEVQLEDMEKAIDMIKKGA